MTNIFSMAHSHSMSVIKMCTLWGFPCFFLVVKNSKISFLNFYFHCYHWEIGWPLPVKRCSLDNNFDLMCQTIFHSFVALKTLEGVSWHIHTQTYELHSVSTTTAKKTKHNRRRNQHFLRLNPLRHYCKTDDKMTVSLSSGSSPEKIIKNFSIYKHNAKSNKLLCHLIFFLSCFFSCCERCLGVFFGPWTVYAFNVWWFLYVLREFHISNTSR